MGISADGREAYVAHFGSDNEPGDTVDIARAQADPKGYQVRKLDQRFHAVRQACSPPT